MSIDQIKNDVNLRGLFLDLISRNLVLGLSNVYSLKSQDYIRLHQEYYQAYQNLSKELMQLVKDEDVYGPDCIFKYGISLLNLLL